MWKIGGLINPVAHCFIRIFIYIIVVLGRTDIICGTRYCRHSVHRCTQEYVRTLTPANPLDFYTSLMFAKAIICSDFVIDIKTLEGVWKRHACWIGSDPSFMIVITAAAPKRPLSAGSGSSSCFMTNGILSLLEPSRPWRRGLVCSDFSVKRS